MSLIVSGVDDSDIEALLEIRLLAMQESLERIGRFEGYETLPLSGESVS